MGNLEWEILAKYLNKETNEEEKLQVENWRSLDTDNEAFFQKMKKVWQQSENILPDAEPQTDKVWQQLSRQIESTSQPEGKQVKISYWPQISKIAAAVLVVFLSGLAIWYVTSARQYLEFNTLSQADSIFLPDGSLIHLNAYSTLKYPRDFDNSQRAVVLKGEAFFEVVKNERQPFIVSAGTAKITVLGTSFNVSAPENSSQVACIVISGKVQMQISENERMKVVLEPGEQGIYNDNELQELPYNDTNSIGWYTGEFIFRENTLAEVVKVLESAYHQEIILQNSALSQCSITANFKGNNLEEMLQVITLTLGLDFEKGEQGWIIKGDGC